MKTPFFIDVGWKGYRTLGDNKYIARSSIDPSVVYSPECIVKSVKQ